MRYEYVRVKLDKNNYALNADMKSHREIIDGMASQGKRYVGWFPVTRFEDGIRRTIDWHLAHRSWWEHVTSGAYAAYYEEHYGTAK